MTILLIGTDAGYGRTGARSDSMNVASIDMKTGNVAIFGLPRNTGNTPLGKKTAKALGMKTYPDMLNALYAAASRHPEIAPDGGDPGAEAVMETASLILGIPIDYYAVVNMMGLVDMVDALGGIDVNLKKALHITYAPLDRGRTEDVLHLQRGRQPSRRARSSGLRARPLRQRRLRAHGTAALRASWPCSIRTAWPS